VEPATCANCAEAHPANFCGCKAFVAKQPKQPHKAVDEIRRRVPKVSSSTTQVTSGQSFAAVVQQNSIPSAPITPTVDPAIASIHALLKQMSEQINFIPALAARVAQ